MAKITVELPEDQIENLREELPSFGYKTIDELLAHIISQHIASRRRGQTKNPGESYGSR